MFLFLIFPCISSENSDMLCISGKFLDTFCKCESVVPPEPILHTLLHDLAGTESKLSCSGSSALKAAIKATIEGNQIFVNLHIFNETFKKIEYHDLKYFPNLKSLSFTDSGISSITDDAFKEQKSLENLDLSGNQISMLQNYVFDPLVALKNMSLSNNQIFSIETETFRNLPNLQYLDLFGNKLDMVDNSWLNSLKSMEFLSLKANKIQSLKPNSFHHLISLQMLDLSFNSISVIPHPVFFPLKNLKFLSLAMNKLDSLSESAFKGNGLLEKVNLTGNLWNCDSKLLLLNDWLKKYEADKERAFCIEPPELQNYTIQHGLDILFLELKIEENPICNDSMCNCTITKDKLVIKVNCSNKDFTHLPESLPYKTKVLNLYNNKIKSLTTDHIDIATWSDVSFLYLNNNVIDSLKGLEGTWLLRNLVALHLSNNKLTEIPIHILEQFRGGLLDDMYLSGNPWNCDCNTVRFQTWLQDNYKAVRNFDGICCSSHNGIYSNQPIYRLLKSQLCPQHVQPVNYLDVLNGLMALAIVIIVAKLSYDYWLQKRTGKLPRFFSLNVA